MFASKAGVPKKRLRLHVTGQEEPFQFSFVSPPAIAESELERFKTLLAAVVTNNSSLTVAAAPTKESKTPKSAPVSKPQTPTPTPPTPARPSPTPYSRSSSSSAPKRGAYGSDVKQRVLTKHPDLAELHTALIIAPGPGRIITEEEFWEGREVYPWLFIEFLSVLPTLSLCSSTCSSPRLCQWPRRKGSLRKFWCLKCTRQKMEGRLYLSLHRPLPTYLKSFPLWLTLMLRTYHR